MLRKLFVRLFFYALPFGLLGLIITGLGVWLGILLPTSSIIRLQDTHNGVFNIYGHTNIVADYKLRSILYYQPDYLILGSSRFFFLREDLVNDDNVQFYNGSVNSLTVSKIRDMLFILAENDKMPQIVLISLDLPDFNAERTSFRTGPLFNLPVITPNWQTELNRINLAYEQLVRDTLVSPNTVFVSLQQVRQSSPRYELGLYSDSFRADGSYGQRPSFLANNSHLGLLNSRFKEYEAGNTVSETSLEALDDIINITQAHNTQLIAVLPPFQPEIYEGVQSADDLDYFNTARAMILERFQNTSAIVHDFSNPADASVQTEHFFDGWHLGEVGSLIMYRQIVSANPEIFLDFTNIDNIRDRIESATNPINLN